MLSGCSGDANRPPGGRSGGARRGQTRAGSSYLLFLFARLLRSRVFVCLGLRLLHAGPGLHGRPGGFVAFYLFFGQQKSNQSRQYGNSQKQQ